MLRQTIGPLFTDLYELTMAAGYFQASKTEETATFELFVRDLPENRNYIVAAGLAQAVEYLTGFRFDAGEIDYLHYSTGIKWYSRIWITNHSSLPLLHKITYGCQPQEKHYNDYNSSFFCHTLLISANFRLKNNK